MTPRELLEAFETLADAPDGVKRLRELVLQLAVHGKLVPQDLVDEPAIALLRRVSLQHPEQRGRASNGNPVAHKEEPYEIPPSWQWVQFCDIFECRLGKMLDAAKNRGEPHPYLRNINVRWGTFDLSDIAKMRLEPHEVTSVSVKRGDLVICEGGEPGRAAVWDLDQEFVVQKALHRARPYLVDSNYYQIHLRVDCASGRIAPLFTGATIKHLTGQALNRHTVTLPPLAEQRRIVARVDELMGLLDQLEATRAVRDDVRRAARDAALAALRDAEDAEALGLAWTRISGQMDALFSKPGDIPPLRQTIRHAAVRGRIVPQDAAEQTADELLEIVRAERKRRWPSQTKPYLQPLHCEWEGLSSALPPGWSVASVEGVTDPVRTVSYGILMPGEDVPGGVPYVKVKDIRANEGCIVVEEVRRTTIEIHRKYIRSELKAGDVLVSIRGTVGKVAQVPAALEGGNVTQDSARLAFLEPMHVPYLMLVLRSPLVQAYWAELSKGAAVQGLNIGDLRPTPLPIPPLPEQHRIVAKVDALMALCDALEARLTATCELQAQFAAAAVHHLDV